MHQDLTTSATQGRLWSLSANIATSFTPGGNGSVCYAALYTNNEILQWPLSYRTSGRHVLQASGVLCHSASRLTLWAVCQGAFDEITLAWDRVEFRLYANSDAGALDPPRDSTPT